MKKNKAITESRFGQFIEVKPKHRFRNFLLLLGLAVLIIFISLGVQLILQRNIVEDNTTWTSSLPSYWGGILGGVISGTISFFGVFLTIKYYRETDATKARIEHMPFIHIEMVEANEATTPCLNKAKVIEVPNRNYEIDKNKSWILDLELENIGGGFAKTIVMHIGTNFGGEAYNKLIKVGDKESMQIRVYSDDLNNSPVFSLQYIDCMTNEYIQMYEIEHNEKSIEIINGYPKFIGQSHEIGT